jgi:hypothetical protein
MRTDPFEKLLEKIPRDARDALFDIDKKKISLSIVRQLKDFADGIESAGDRRQQTLLDAANNLKVSAERLDLLCKLARLLKEYEGSRSTVLGDLVALESELDENRTALAKLVDLKEGKKGKEIQIDRASKIYREILSAVMKYEITNAADASRAAYRLRNTDLFKALQKSLLPLYPDSSTTQDTNPRTISLSDVRNISRLTKDPYLSDELIQALQHGGDLGDTAWKLVNTLRSSTLPTERCTSIATNFQSATRLLAIARAQSPEVNSSELIEKILSIGEWPQGKRILDELEQLASNIDVKTWSQQKSIPHGWINLVHDLYEKLHLPDAKSGLSRKPAHQNPYLPDDLQTLGNNEQYIEKLVAGLFQGALNEVLSYEPLLQAGWQILAVGVRQLGDGELKSGLRRQFGQEISREIDIIAISPATDTEAPMLAVIEVKSSVHGVLEGTFNNSYKDANPDELELNPHGQTLALSKLAHVVAEHFTSLPVNNDTIRMLHVIAPYKHEPSPREMCALERIPILLHEISGGKITYDLKGIDYQSRRIIDVLPRRARPGELSSQLPGT